MSNIGEIISDTLFFGVDCVADCSFRTCDFVFFGLQFIGGSQNFAELFLLGGNIGTRQKYVRVYTERLIAYLRGEPLD